MPKRIKYVNKEGQEKYGVDTEHHLALFDKIGFAPEKAKAAPKKKESAKAVEK